MSDFAKTVLHFTESKFQVQVKTVESNNVLL